MFLVLLIIVGVAIYFSARKPKSKQTAPSPVNSNTAPKFRRLLQYPTEINGCKLAYYYVLEFQPKDGINVVKDVLGDTEKFVEVDADGDVVTLIHNGITFGEIQDARKAQMVKDFKRRGEPYHAILLTGGNKVNLRFYKDKLKTLARYESEIVKLRNIKGGKKQEIIEWLEPNDELDFDGSDEKINVEHEGELIGRLPASIEKRVFDDGEGIIAIYVDHIEESENDEGDIIYIPYAKVFWEN